MKITILLVSSIFLSVSCSFAQGIRFTKGLNWNQIKQKARTEGKYIMMDTYTTWCGPCKAMTLETFPQKAVGEVINSNFIAVKIQIDQTINDNDTIRNGYTDAKEIDRQFKISAYPTMLFFSPDGKLVSRAVGFLDAVSLIAEARKALDPKCQYYTLLEQFKLHKLDTAQMKKLITMAERIQDFASSKEVSQEVILNISSKDVYTKENLIFIAKHLTGSHDKSFGLFRNNELKVNSILGENQAETVIMDVIYKEEIAPYEESKNVDWEKIGKGIKKKYGKLGEERFWAQRMLTLANNGEYWVDFGRYYNLYFNRALPFNRSIVDRNEVSWLVVEHVVDKAVINTATKVMKHAVQTTHFKSGQAFDTYANLLYKIGKKADALEWEEKAVALIPWNKDVVENLTKMKAGVVLYP